MKPKSDSNNTAGALAQERLTRSTYITSDGRRCDNCNAPLYDHKDQRWCPCGTCDGSGSIDSGGVHPWGEAAMTECPECRYFSESSPDAGEKGKANG
jgi:hypothetical protein